MSLSSNEIIDKQLTQLFERTHCVRRDLTEPNSRWSFEGGKEGSTHNPV